MKKSYNIRILGQELSVLSDAEEEQVANVVQFVNDKIEEVMQSKSGLKTLNVAILAALNISEELLKLKGVKKELCEQLESRADKLIQLIDNAN
ncbi:MAG TPA: cell division protein ZapA [Smithellaceae bacterium]|nr:cell division protein ZapA [Smithellaceae bacterium]HRS89887.1 cell division protein ZapA [Smithellaceae bacterium]HRV26714.1 cell division protein ZapA [Smithellaceae bacterium]